MMLFGKLVSYTLTLFMKNLRPFVCLYVCVCTCVCLCVCIKYEREIRQREEDKEGGFKDGAREGLPKKVAFGQRPEGVLWLSGEAGVASAKALRWVRAQWIQRQGGSQWGGGE